MEDDLTEIQKLKIDFQLTLAKKNTEFLEMQEVMRSRERKLELNNLQLQLENQNLKQQNNYLNYLLEQFQARFETTFKKYVDLFKSSKEIGNKYENLNKKLFDEINLLDRDLKKFTRGPDVKAKKTDDFWKAYKRMFDEYINKGKSESWAIDKIKKQIEKDGKWQQKSKNDPSKILTSPEKGTIRRQLITKFK